MESGLAALPVAVTQQNNTTTNAQKNKGGFGGGLLYILRNIGAGIVGVGEGIYDYIVGGFAKAAGNESYARRLMENNISVRMQQRAYEDFNPNKGWEFAGQVASGIGQSTVGLVVAAGLTAATGGGALVAGLASGATIGLSAAGLSTADAYNKTGELGGKEFLYGAASGLVEGGLEGVTGAAGKIGARVAKQTARSTAKNVVRKSLVKDVFTDACGEFVEESLSEIIQPYLERGLKIDENAENATAQEVVYAGLVGFVSGALMSGTTSAAMSARNAARGDNAIKTGKVNEIINEATAISKYVTEAENSKLVLPAFRDMTASLNAYNNTADKTSLLAKTYLGEVQRGIAYVRASAFVQNSRDNIMNNADAIVDWYAKQGQTISADDIRADKDGIATRIAISDVAGKLIMPDYTSRTMGTAINKAEKEFRKKGIISDETNNEIVDAYRQMERLNVERNGGTIDEADYTYSQDYRITADDLKKFKDGADFMQKRDMLADNYENSYDRDNQNMAIFSAISSGKTTVAEVEAIKKLAKRGGVKVRWENIPIKDGNVVNGSYESGTITINVRGVDSFSRTVVHEYIHNIAKNAQTVFAKLRTAIESVCAENAELQKVYDNAIEAYKKAEPGKSDAYYAEDAVCKVAERFISEFGTNEKGKIDLSNVDKGHIRTIREFFNRIRERVKQFGVKKSNDNMTNVIRILDEILSKKTVDKSKNVANNKVKGEVEYARYSIDQQDAENQFRRLQEASKRLSDRDVALYHSGREQVDEIVRGRLARVFRDKLGAERSRLRYDIRVLKNSETGADVKIYENVSAQTFHDIFEIVHKYLKYGDAVDVHNVKSSEWSVGYADTKNFLTSDGLGGFAITKNGDLVSVFNLGQKGFLRSISDYVKEQGAKTLDCYNSIAQPLPIMYKKLGFQSASVLEFNYDIIAEDRGKAYADEFVKTYGEAPVHFMVLTDQNVETKHFSKDQYDEAVAYQQSFTKKIKENNRKSYAGQQSQTWDESRRDRAIDMMLDKKSPEEIYRETGLFIGADGYMRYEIDDSKMKVNRHIPVSDSSTLSSIDKTNKLNEHYKERVIYYERTIEDFQTRLDGYNLPDFVVEDYKKSIRRYKKEIADIKKEIRINDNRLNLLLNEAQVNIDIDKAGVNALYNKDTTTKAKLSEIITHDELFKAYPQIRNVEIVFNKNMKKGEFANATIPQKGGVRSSAYIEVSKQAFYKDGVFSVDEFKKTLMHEVQHIIQAYEGFANGSLPSEQYERLRRIAVADYKKNPSAYKNIADTAEEFADVMVTPRDAFRAYQNVYGEQEARNVEDRLKLSKEERAKTMPFAGNKDSILSTGERPINGVASQKSYTDEFATLAMQWAHSDKTKVGERTIRFKGDVPVVIEKTEDGFRKIRIKEKAESSLWRKVNEHNDRQRESGVLTDAGRLRTLPGDLLGNSGNDEQRHKQGERDGGLYRGKSQRDRNGTDKQSDGDRRYSISDQLEQAHPLLEMPTHERSKRIVDIKERAKDTKTSFLIGWVNAQAGIEKYCKLLGEKNIEATTNFARASSSAANYMIEKELRPLFESLKKGRSYDKEYATVFMEYLLHWHNTDRMAQGIEKPVFGESVSAEDSRARISNIEKVHPEFKALAVQVWEYGKKLLTMQKDGGLITQELYDTLSARYPHYVPTFRDGEGAQTIGAIRGKGFIEINRSIKSAKGSDLNILPIDVMLARKTMQIFKASRINAVAQSLCRAGIADENMSRVAVIGRERVNADVDYDLYRPKNNQITFFENGEAVTLAVSSDIFKGFDAFHSNPNSEWNNPILNATTKWNNAFKKLVTAYNPFFTVRNALRDLQDAGLYTRHSWAQFAKNYAVAYKEITTNGKYWQEYRAAGGLNSSVFDYERGYKRSPSGLKKALSIIETVNIAVEQAPRLSEFISSRQAGVGVEQSLLNAADVTVNFGRSGVFARKLNSTAVPFLNPSIQGFDKFIRTAFGRKTAKEWVRLIIRAAMLGIGAGLLNDLLLGDDDEYKNLRQTDKENYYILKIGQGKFLKLPKGRINASIGQIFYTSKQLANKEKVDWKSELSNLNANMSPVENLGRFVWSPFTDAASNRTWYGTPIESTKFENVAPKNRYDENTSSIAIAIGKAINYSPKKINYLLDQYTGIIGDIVLPVTTKASSRNIIEQNFTLDSVSQSKTSTAFYDEIEEATYAKNDGDLLAKAKLSYLNKMKKKVSDLNRKKREIQNSGLSNSEKKEQVRALQVLINGIQNTALQNVGIFEDELSRYNLTDETYDAVYLAAYRSAFGAQSAFEQYDTNVYAKAKLMNTLGIDYENYFDIYFTLKTTENDVDKKGNVVKGSKKNKATKYIKSLKGLSAVQKAIILATAGYSLNDSLKSKVKSLAKGLSEEDKAMLYNICGITDKKKSITAVA